MRPGDTTSSEVLVDAWERWARRCAELTPEQWRTPTRCHPWDVHALTAHVCPDPTMFDMVDAARVDGPPAVADAAELLRGFNRPGGAAHTMADQLADHAVSDGATLTTEHAVARFEACTPASCVTPQWLAT